MLDGIQRAAGAITITNVIKWVIVKPEGVRAEMDGKRAPVEGILIANKFSIQVFQRALQARLRGFGM